MAEVIPPGPTERRLLAVLDECDHLEREIVSARARLDVLLVRLAADRILPMDERVEYRELDWHVAELRQKHDRRAAEAAMLAPHARKERLRAARAELDEELDAILHEGAIDDSRRRELEQIRGRRARPEPAVIDRPVRRRTTRRTQDVAERSPRDLEAVASPRIRELYQETKEAIEAHRRAVHGLLFGLRSPTAVVPLRVWLPESPMTPFVRHLNADDRYALRAYAELVRPLPGWDRSTSPLRRITQRLRRAGRWPHRTPKARA